MIGRAIGIVVLLGLTAFVERSIGVAEAIVPRESLDSLPLVIDGWSGRAATPLAKDVVAQLGVDEHVYRTYTRSGIPVSLYAGYYGSQRRGDVIHSPQNCLPGAGWQPVASTTVDVPTSSGPVRVNQYLIQKGPQKQLVLYWYQGRGRVVANEYANKAYLMWDAAIRRRTSGGLVRIVTPVVTTPENAAQQAEAFAVALLPRLREVMP